MSSETTLIETINLDVSKIQESLESKKELSNEELVKMFLISILEEESCQ